MFVPSRRLRFDPRSVSTQVDVKILHIHDIWKLPRSVKSMDIVIAFFSDPIVVITDVSVVGGAKFIDFVMRKDIAKFKTGAMENLCLR